MPRLKSGKRREDILQSLVRILEQHQGERVTTAMLAEAVGVSEAALYRHFPSKRKMYEALIEFVEETLFTRINRIVAEETDTALRIHQIMVLILGFAEKNPGITRLLKGDVLMGEARDLQERISQMFDRLETQFKQVLREGELRHEVQPPVSESARLLLAMAEGLISQYVRSGFRDKPMSDWDGQWTVLSRTLFLSAV
ncbi:MAG: nucleoid occlusion factor SlmA [Gammaproteobacteria bacterium]|nr:MAG: nucleoid occlusion factor SlmA [Gammaproteobacteria bacterium]